MVKTIVIAAFKITDEKSIYYQKFKTTKGAAIAFMHVIDDLEPDYISVRVIKNGEPK